MEVRLYLMVSQKKKQKVVLNPKGSYSVACNYKRTSHNKYALSIQKEVNNYYMKYLEICVVFSVTIEIFGCPSLPHIDFCTSSSIYQVFKQSVKKNT